jgi:hypothetical protein
VRRNYSKEHIHVNTTEYSSAVIERKAEPLLHDFHPK